MIVGHNKKSDKYLQFLCVSKGKIQKAFCASSSPQPVKMDLIKKFLPKQKTIQTLKVDAQGFRKP